MAAAVMGESKSGFQEKCQKDNRQLRQLQQIEDAEDSTDSLDQDRPSSPVRMTREEVLSVLGYRSERVPKTPTNVWSSQRSDLCHRCGKKVYQLERLDVGELYHRGCLKCYVCGVQLSLKTFHRVVTDAAKEVYCKTHIPKVEKSASKDSIGIRSAVEAQKKASEKVFKPYEQSSYKYNPEALEFQHARQIKERQKVKRRSSLKTNADFEKFGVFAAQADLEKRHHQEEDELYRQIFEERQRLMRNLNELLSKEKEHTVKELVTWFEKQGSSKQEREDGIKKLEQFYLQQREDRIKKLLEGMAVEERAAVDRLIDKHAQEMLFLIEEKEREAEQSLASPSRDRIGRDAYKYLSFAPSSKTEQDKDIAEEEEEEEEEQADIEAEEEEQQEEKEVHHEEEEREEEEEDDEERDVEEEEEEAEEEEDMNKDEELHKLSHGQIRDSVEEDVEEEEMEVAEPEDENKHQPSDLPEDLDRRLQEELEIEDAVRTSESTDTDKSTCTNIAVAFETLHEVEIQKLKTFPKKQKAMTESKTTQHTAQTMADEETQTRSPVPKHRSAGQRPSEYSHSRGTKSSLKQHQADRSPQAKTKKGSLPGSQFQIIISTERVANDEYMEKRRGESPTSRLKETAAVPASRASPRGGRINVAKDEETEEEEDEEPVKISTQPDAQPPVCRKSKLYRTPEIFKEFDQRAIEEAKKDPLSFTDLVRRLSHKCETDLQKVRAIFRWITAKDLNKMKFMENESSDSPMGLLKGIKYGTESYHNLFKRLCSYAGLHCKVIDGFSKGAGYRPGSKFKGDRFRNQWTAVWVDDSWRFINCNWGARHVKRVGDDHMTYKIDEFYFLTDPEEHIYQHFPDDPRWQLLKNPITLEDFVHLPVVKSPFFNNRLEFIMKTYSILKATDGRVELRLRAPKLMSFAVKLKSKDRTVRDESLKECCIIRMVNDHVVFLADLPSAGQFYWEIFVDSAWSSESMDNACSFLLYSSKVPSAHQSYPQIGCFGRTPACEKFEISEGTDYDPLVISTGELVVAFKVPKRTLRLSHSLHYWDPREKAFVDFDRFAFLKSRLDSNAYFVIRCPNKGIYVLKLLVVDPSVARSKPVIFYQYLIDCRVAVANAHPLPQSSSKWYGCRIVEPLFGELRSNTKVQFQVESKLATEVVASMSGTWLALQRNSNNIWQALISTGDKSGKLCLYGRFESSTDKYIPLWKFVIKEATAVDEVRTLFKYL